MDRFYLNTVLNVVVLSPFLRVCFSQIVKPKCFWYIGGEDSDNIDLKSVLTDNSNQTFITYDKNNSTRFYYNPCYMLNNGNAMCNTSALCKEDLLNSEFENIGDFSDVRVEILSNGDYYRIDYNVLQTSVKKDSTITLECMYIDKPQFRYRRSDLQDKYYFSLASTRFCRSKFSIGTIMCVSLLSIVLVYLVVGILYKKAVLGVSGLQLIPNVTFWAALPGLIKDGYLFFISPCIGNRREYDNYERI
ncbi:cln5-like protein 1 [Mytilus edulis]|uniref:cln5-like protein 1 n=1 Tax=Mytilus edulis TaxID=6550 RepID=UPI0039EE930B